MVVEISHKCRSIWHAVIMNYHIEDTRMTLEFGRDAKLFLSIDVFVVGLWYWQWLLAYDLLELICVIVGGFWVLLVDCLFL